MFITSALLSKGGKEVHLKTEDGLFYSISVPDAKICGIYDAVTDDSLLPLETDGEFIEFCSEKLKCIHYAAYLLSFGDKSRKALLFKLKTKGFDKELCEAALEVLENSGLINDESLCARKLESIAKSRLYGPRRLKSELLSKGFSSDIIDDAFDSVDLDFDDLLEQLITKLIRGNMPETDKELLSLKNKLVRYGYDYSSIDRLLKDFSD